MPILLNRNSSRGFAAAALAVALSAAFAPPAHAALATLTLNGIFNGTTTYPTETITGPGAPTLTANDPFTLTGVFNTSSPNLIAGLPFPVNYGWVDFAPLSVTLTVGGSTYSVATYDGSLPFGGPGLTVAIFGDTTIFSPAPLRRSVISQQASSKTPSQDGAGIVGDWTDLSPGYTVPGLVTTTYPTSDFYGVGFGNGVCTGGPGSGVGCTTTPIPLDGGLYELSLGGSEGYDLNNPLNSTDDPTNGPYPNPINSQYFFSAQLTVPEPSTWALLLVGFAGLAIAGDSREQKGTSRGLIRRSR